MKGRKESLVVIVSMITVVTIAVTVACDATDDSGRGEEKTWCGEETERAALLSDRHVITHGGGYSDDTPWVCGLADVTRDRQKTRRMRCLKMRRCIDAM